MCFGAGNYHFSEPTISGKEYILINRAINTTFIKKIFFYCISYRIEIILCPGESYQINLYSK